MKRHRSHNWRGPRAPATRVRRRRGAHRWRFKDETREYKELFGSHRRSAQHHAHFPLDRGRKPENMCFSVAHRSSKCLKLCFLSTLTRLPAISCVFSQPFAYHRNTGYHPEGPSENPTAPERVPNLVAAGLAGAENAPASTQIASAFAAAG